jgi:hypothetical protein
MSITNTDVILAAINATGPKPIAPVMGSPKGAESEAAYALAFAAYGVETTAYDQRLKASAREIKVMLTEESAISLQLIALDKALDKNSSDGKIFAGTIVAVAKEAKTSRAIVTLYTGTDRETKDAVTKTVLPLGHEQLRTDLTYNADGRAMARSAQLLIGRRVTVYVELEGIRGGTTKVRVLRHIEDGGADTRFDAVSGQVIVTAAAA